VVLVTGAGSGVSEKGIHVLHQGYPGFYNFQEVPVEPIDKAVKRLVKMEKQGDIVTITSGKKKNKIDIAKFNYDNPGEPYAINKSRIHKVLYKTLCILDFFSLGSSKVEGYI
jgi:hypothetical protein